MQLIPLIPTASQTVAVNLNGQNCQIEVYQKFFGLFLNLYVDATLIIGGVLCQDRNLIVRSAYLGFDGDLIFIDNDGTADPTYTGLGTQFNLAYVTSAELTAAES